MILSKIKGKLAKLSSIIIEIQTIIVLSLAYFLVMVPLGFIQKVINGKEIRQSGYWKKVIKTENTVKIFYKQY